MSQHYYEEGATHNDHHKEINISGGHFTEKVFVDLVKGFFDCDNVEDAEIVDECRESSIREKEPATARGPRKRVLFEDADTHKENTAVKNREKDRFLHYLSEHRLKSRLLVCAKDDTLNQTVVCFLKLWIEHGIIGEHPSGAAVFRFLTQDCGITSSVTERSYGNKMSERLKNIKTEYDTVTFLKVKKCFEKK